MAETLEHIEGTFTYTYDLFTVFFYGDHVFVGGKEYPIGQCCVDIMNLDEAVLDGIKQRVGALIPAARALLIEKTDSAAALAQERLNAVWDIMFALPVYRDLKMDEECNYHTFQQLRADRAKWSQVTDFLLTEFYRGLALGNAPRRCHNCGRYFLLTKGYNTCYCNNIAPGETERTCRKVGAHRKEAQGKEKHTPAQKEYDRTYNP